VRARRGISIIELTVVITGVAMMLGLCAISLRLLMQLNTDAHARLNGLRAFQRLSGQFRDDVHACQAAELDAGPASPAGPVALRLAIEPDHSIRYQVRDAWRVRDELRAGKTVRHESFALPRGRIGQFERRTEADHPLVALVLLERPSKGRTDPPRSVEILASPGKDRFVKRGAGS
jgi:hypothetical protein